MKHVLARCWLSLLALGFCAALVSCGRRHVAAACPAFFAGGELPDDRFKDAQQAMLLCHSAYASLTSWRTRDPVWSAEHLTVASVAAAHQLRRHGTFHPDSGLPTGEEAELDDYTHSGWDRGHMAPDGDMPTPAAQEESFDLANMVPQAPRLNRVVWARIERAVREIALERGEAYVLTGPAFDGPPHVIGPDRVLVPMWTWKAVYVPSAGAGVAWICTNANATTCRRETVDALEGQVGMTLFPGAPSDLPVLPG